jgi:hypothetical protein
MAGIDIARREGLIDVVSSYNLNLPKQVILGAVPLGGYPINPRFLLNAYRGIGGDQETLDIALRDDADLLSLSDDLISTLSVDNCRADLQLGNDGNFEQVLPLLTNSLAREHLRFQFTNIARARIATVVKTIGFCASKQLAPLFGSANYSAVAARIAKRANDVLDLVSEDDPSWASRARVLRVAHEEYIDETVLDSMSIDDVLKLRTHAWGHQAEAREELLQSVAELSKEIGDKASFVDEARKRIAGYRAKAEDLVKQRVNLRLRINCDVAKAVGGSASVAGGSLGLLTQLQSAIGVGTTLVAGCIYTADKIKDYCRDRYGHLR